jgi:hypothetical protein
VSKAPGTEFPTDKQRPRPRKEAYDMDTGVCICIFGRYRTRSMKKRNRRRSGVHLVWMCIYYIADDQCDNTRTGNWCFVGLKMFRFSHKDQTKQVPSSESSKIQFRYPEVLCRFSQRQGSLISGTPLSCVGRMGISVEKDQDASGDLFRSPGTCRYPLAGVSCPLRL